MSASWETALLTVFDRWLARYRAGETNWEAFANAEDEAFLRIIGYKPRELFDYVEDHANYGEPDAGTIINIAGVRREYLLEVQGGKPSSSVIKPSDLPAKTDAIEGIPWLPRLIKKAEGKLRGELDPEIMYCCPGDWAFFDLHGLDPVEFLRFVWECDGDRDRIVQHVVAAGN
jgi:hypothetical protein